MDQDHLLKNFLKKTWSQPQLHVLEDAETTGGAHFGVEDNGPMLES